MYIHCQKDVFGSGFLNKQTSIGNQSLAQVYDVGNYSYANHEIIYIDQDGFAKSTSNEEYYESFFKNSNIFKPKVSVRSIDEKYCINYSKHDILGKGAFGMVRKCKIRSDLFSSFQNCNNPELAIKMVDKEKLKKTPTYQQLLFDEISILQEVQHPSIFQIVEIVEDPVNYCIVSQVVKGGPIIKRLLRDGPMSEDEAKVIVKQILSCLLYLHSKGIVHRDIKLENILFSSPDNTNLKVRLIDFGFATKYNR